MSSPVCVVLIVVGVEWGSASSTADPPILANLDRKRKAKNRGVQLILPPARVLKGKIVHVAGGQLAAGLDSLVSCRVELRDWPAFAAEKKAALVAERREQFEHGPHVAVRAVAGFDFDQQRRPAGGERLAGPGEHGRLVA